MQRQQAQARGRRDRVVMFRATSEEVAVWTAAARRDCRTLSGWIRALATRAAASDHAEGTLEDSP